MEYESFGRSGLKTSRLCFGAMLLSTNGLGPWRMPAVADEATSAALLDRYVAAGGNFIDTSNNYGESEAIIGNWLQRQNKHMRRKLIICTKFTSPVNTIPSKAAFNYVNSSGSSRKHIMDAIEDSLDKLQTNYIDVYTIHYWDDATQLEDVIRTLQILIQMGRIRYYGVSNYTPVQLHQLITLCQRNNWEFPLFIQSQYNLLCRTAEWELTRLCQDNGIGFLAWSPLAGGWLSNRYSHLENAGISQAPVNSRMSFAESVHFSSWDLSTMGANPKTWMVLRACSQIATELKATISQVAIRWIFSQTVTGCIVGPRTLAHLQDNLDALQIKLTPKHIQMLNDASHTSPIYPYCAFSELTVKPSTTTTTTNALVANKQSTSLNVYPGLEQLILLSSTFEPTANRSSWMARLINQHVYDLAANVNRYHRIESVSSSKSLNRSSSVKLALIFGGFLTAEGSLTTLQQIFNQLVLSAKIRSFINDGLELLNRLILQSANELNINWMENNFNLFEWIQIGLPEDDCYGRLNFSISSSILLLNQVIVLMHFLECSNVTIGQLKRSSIFLSGFSIGTITAYIVDISNSYEQLRHNALAAIRLCFWFGLRATEDFHKWKMEQYKSKQTNQCLSSIESDDNDKVNYNTGSLQISKVPFQDVFNVINAFNNENEFGYHFDVCVVSQCDQLTITGFANHLPVLVEYLKSEFPSCSLVSVGLDIPLHCYSYFPTTASKILDDFTREQPQFEGSSTKNQWNRTILYSDTDGEPSVGVTCIELINSILIEVSRWDLVSDSLSRIIKSNLSSSTTDSCSNSVIVLDFGPSTRSMNLINNSSYLKECLSKQQICVYTTLNLPQSLISSVSKINEETLNEHVVIKIGSSIIHYEDPIRNSIAIIGMACRYPDANSIDEFYSNLLNRKHSLQVIPKTRWDHSRYYTTNPKNVYQTNAQHMGIIDEIDLFDPQFFNINMRDATHMDPQHRLTLEMCYLALENAGYVIGEGARMGLNEQRIGVFVGCTGTDGYRKNMEAHMDAYLGQCEARSMQAGRVSYFFKFCGPSIQLDTACAGSLVCLHLAVESILNGECDAAVVSAVLISTDPVEYLALAAGGFFSTNSTGGCAAFVSRADGYTRSDGIAAIVIKPYINAKRDRDLIHALINSTTVNQSGQSQNLLLPSQPQIETLIQTVLHKAHILPSAIQYIEAHGTGTQGGDPIETNAIVKTLANQSYRSKDNPLYIGSHKAFIGHSEAAAGLAGLIKTVMMLQHQTITPHIPSKDINPKIDLNEYVIIPDEIQSWTLPDSQIARRAIVNSFGFSGANASCVIQETPIESDEYQHQSIEPFHLITISGKHPDSVRAYTLRFIQYLIAFQSKSPSTNDEFKFLRDLSFTTTARRNHFINRLAIVTSSVKDLIQSLTSILSTIPDQLDRLTKTIGSQYSHLLTSSSSNNQHLFLSTNLQQTSSKESSSSSSSSDLPTRIVFVLGGQGSQYFGMCQQLLQYSNVWSSTFRLCSKILFDLHPNLFSNNQTLLELLENAHQSLLTEEEFHSTQVCQPLLFSIEYSLGKMLMAWGITPDYMIGHSIGEIVAACLSSAISLEDALFLVGHRAQFMEQTIEGSMLAINCDVEQFNQLCQQLHLNQLEVSLAGHNGIRSIVVSGLAKTIDILHSHITTNKLFLCKKLNIKHPFHTHFMKPILNEFRSIANRIIYKKCKIAIIDTLNGQLRTQFNAQYWSDQIEQTVQFHSALSYLYNLSIKEKFQPICIELSPTPILLQYLTESERNFQTYSILRKNRNDFEQIYSVLAELYVHKLSSINWSQFHCLNRHARVLSLPNYAFNHKSCWLKLPWMNQTSTNELILPKTMPKENIDESIGITEELPLIGKCQIISDESNKSLECYFPIFDRPWRVDIQNHIVAGKCLFSIPLYVCLTSQFTHFAIQRNQIKTDSFHSVTIQDLMIKTPFIWDEETDSKQESCRYLSIILTPSKTKIRQENQSPSWTFSVASRKRQDNQPIRNSKLIIHSSGTIYFTNSQQQLNNNKTSFQRTINAIENPQSTTTTSYNTEEFYKLSSQFGTTYGPHYQSIQQTVISQDAQISWAKQIMKTNQSYSDTTNRILIYPTWLDSFVQGATLQVAKLPELNRPFVAMFVENFICQLNVFQTTTQQQTPFYNENQVKINSPDLITGETRGFDKDGNCLVFITGAIMMSATTKFNGQSKNDKVSTISKQSSDQNQQTIENIIIELISNSLQIDSNTIDKNENFANLGIDSLLSIEIRGELKNIFEDISLPPSVLFDYPSVNQLMKFILSLNPNINNDEQQSNDVQSQQQQQQQPSSDDYDDDDDDDDETQLDKFEGNDASEIRVRLSEIIGQSLKMSPSTIEDNQSLIDKNTSPLQLTHIRLKLQQVFSIPFSSQILFDHSTLKQLTLFIQNQQQTSNASPSSPPKISTIKSIYSKVKLPQIVTSDHDLMYEPFPMVNLCQAYTLGQFLPKMAVRSHVFLVKSFDLNFNGDKLEMAWNECIRRHPMLRCQFNSEMYLQILKEVPHYSIKRFHTSTEFDQQQQIDHLKKWRLDICVNTKWPLIELFLVYGPTKTVLIFDGDIVVVDFHSLLVVCEDMLCIYKNQMDKLRPVCSINYRDYIMHYRHVQETCPRAQEQKQYWINRLSTIPGGIQFPKSIGENTNVLPVRNPGFDSKTRRLDASVWQQIQTSIRSRGLQSATTVCALFASVLSVFCNCNHFTLNIVFVNRLPFHDDVERLVGNLSSALLLEFDFRNTELTFYEHSKNIYQQFLSDLAHSSFFTASSLVPILNNRRHSTLLPVSSVAFVSLLQFDEHFQSLTDEDFGFYFERNAPNTDYAVLETAAMELDHQIALTADGSLSMAFDFIKDLLPEHLMDNFIDCYLQKLLSLIHDETWQSKSMLFEYNIQQFHKENICSSSSSSSSLLLFNRFVELATNSSSAHNIALISSHNDSKLTYEQLLFLSLKLAGQLNKLIEKRQIHIGVTCQRGFEQIISCLSISMVGCVFVPIDGDLPFEQYETRLKLADISIICTTKTMFEQIRQQSTNNDFYEHIQFVEVDLVLSTDKCLNEIDSNINPNSCAYIIFTSGTTGQPKAVSISHHAAMNTINDVNQRIDLKATDRILALANLSFDLSIWDIFGALNSGCSLVLLDQENNTASDPFCWLQVIDKYQITIWNSIPQLLYLLYHAIDQNQIQQRKSIRSLRQILLSGDWIPIELPSKFYSLWKFDENNESSLRMLSLGGATECSIWSVFHWIDCQSCPNIYSQWQSIPYGQPLNGQSLYVLSSTLDYCPDYVTGQLFIGGQGLANEYYGNQQLTTRSFIIHPKTNERLYATGDSARFRLFGEDRVVELLGRIQDDRQVKIQGYRVECAEIECLLNNFEIIKQSIVISLTNNSTLTGKTTFDKSSGSILVAFIVLRNITSDHQTKTELFIRKYCQKSLPHYMVPHTIIFIDEIPRSFNGKIDRKALLTIYSQHNSTSFEFVGDDLDLTKINSDESLESSSNLMKLWSIWNRALHRSDQILSNESKILTNLNLLTLGATSLTLLMIRAMIQHEFCLTLPLKFFMEESRLFQMTQRIEIEMKQRKLDDDDDDDDQHQQLDDSSTKLTKKRSAHLICLNRTESATYGPIVFLHPSTGTIQCFNQIIPQIIEHTGPRFIYAIQAFGLDIDEPVETNFAEIIETYFDAIQSILTSTLTLIGYSSGGILAYAIAQQFILRNQFNSIQSIILLDTPSPLHYLPIVTDEKVHAIVRHSINPIHRSNVSFENDALSRILAVTKANLVSIQNYYSQTIHIPLNLKQFTDLISKIVLVRATDHHIERDNADSSWGWEQYSRRIIKLISDKNHIDEDLILNHLKKPIWTPGTHFDLLTQTDVTDWIHL